jgi:hypothetical protein
MGALCGTHILAAMDEAGPWRTGGILPSCYLQGVWDLFHRLYAKIREEQGLMVGFWVNAVWMDSDIPHVLLASPRSPPPTFLFPYLPPNHVLRLALTL